MGKNEGRTQSLEHFFAARVIHTADLLYFVDVLMECCRLYIESNTYMRLRNEVDEIMAEVYRGDWDALKRRSGVREVFAIGVEKETGSDMFLGDDCRF
jgi:hypothetical protein